MTPLQTHLLAKRYEMHLKRADRRAGGVIAMLYNVNRDTKIDPDGKDWQDFFTEWKDPPKPQTEEEMFEMMLMFTKQREGLSS